MVGGADPQMHAATYLCDPAAETPGAHCYGDGLTLANGEQRERDYTGTLLSEGLRNCYFSIAD